VQERDAVLPAVPYVSFNEGLDALAGSGRPDRH
jgi:hypothetical protein